MFTYVPAIWPSGAAPVVPSQTARLEAEVADLRQHVIRQQTLITALEERIKALEPRGVMPVSAMRHGVP